MSGERLKEQEKERGRKRERERDRGRETFMVRRVVSD